MQQRQCTISGALIVRPWFPAPFRTRGRVAPLRTSVQPRLAGLMAVSRTGSLSSHFGRVTSGTRIAAGRCILNSHASPGVIDVMPALKSQTFVILLGLTAPALLSTSTQAQSLFEALFGRPAQQPRSSGFYVPAPAPGPFSTIEIEPRRRAPDDRGFAGTGHAAACKTGAGGFRSGDHLHRDGGFHLAEG
jgi:hypothetical protein